MGLFDEGISGTVSNLAQGTAQVAQGTVSALVNYFELGKDPQQNLLKAIRNHNHHGFAQKIARLDVANIVFPPESNPLFVACYEATQQIDNADARVNCMQIINHILDDEALHTKFAYMPVRLSEKEQYYHLVHMTLVHRDYELTSHLISRDFTFKNHDLMHDWALSLPDQSPAIFLMTMGYPLVNHAVTKSQHASPNDILMPALQMERYDVAIKCLELMTPEDRDALQAYYHIETPLDFVIQRLLHYLKLYTATQPDELLIHIHGLLNALTVMQAQGFSKNKEQQHAFQNHIRDNLAGCALLVYLLDKRGQSSADILKLTDDSIDKKRLNILWATLVGTEMVPMPEAFDKKRQMTIKRYAAVLPHITQNQFNFGLDHLESFTDEQFNTLKELTTELKERRLQIGLQSIHRDRLPFDQFRAFEKDNKLDSFKNIMSRLPPKLDNMNKIPDSPIQRNSP